MRNLVDGIHSFAHMNPLIFMGPKEGSQNTEGLKGTGLEKKITEPKAFTPWAPRVQKVRKAETTHSLSFTKKVVSRVTDKNPLSSKCGDWVRHTTSGSFLSGSGPETAPAKQDSPHTVGMGWEGLETSQCWQRAVH